MASLKNFYTPEACDKLISSIQYAEDSIRYLLNCPQSNKDNKFVTPELLESFSDLAASCKELYSAYSYYIKAEHWKAKDEFELVEISAKAIANLLIESGKNPVEALAAVRKLYEE